MLDMFSISPTLGQMLGGALLPPVQADRDPRSAPGEAEGTDPLAELASRRMAPGEIQARLLSIEIEYQSTRMLQLETGETVVETTRVNFKAVEAYIGAGATGAAGDLLDRLRGQFSPRNVAGRIAGFALDRFAGQEDPDSEAGMIERSDFRDRAVTAVRDGVDEALRRLRGLPEEIHSLGEEIYKVVELILEEFVEEGEVSPPAETSFAQVQFGYEREQVRIDLVA